MSNNADEQMITLQSSDGEEFMVSQTVAKVSQTICHMIEDGRAQGSIMLPNVTAKILAKVIEYCEKHVSDSKQADAASRTELHGSAAMLEREIEIWDKEFANIDQATIFDLIRAARYLNIQGLFDLTCKTMVNQMPPDNSIEVIRNIIHEYRRRRQLARNTGGLY